MGLEDRAWKFELDLDGSGNYATDVSAYVEGVEFGEGSQTALQAPSPPQATVELDNEDSRFSPRNTASPYYPNFKRWKRARLRVQVTTPAVVTINDHHSFENDVNGVVGTSFDVARETGFGYVGKACLKLTKDVAGAAFATISKRDGTRLPVTAGQSYAASYFAKGSAFGGTVSIRIRWFDGAGASLGDATQTFTLPAEFARFYAIGAAPTGAATAQVLFHDESVLAVGNIVYIDGFNFVNSASRAPYVDGDQAACSWDGTAHQSTARRPANPILGVMLGRIADITGTRKDVVRVRLKSFTDEWATKRVNMGLIARLHRGASALKKRVGAVLNRLIDLAEPGLIADASMETSAEHGTWAALGNAAKMAYNAALDGQTAFEGSHEQRFSGNTAIGDGARKVVTSLTSNLTGYTIAVFVKSDTARAMRLRMTDQNGTVGFKDFTPAAGLTGQPETYVELTNIPWPSTSTARNIEIIDNTGGAAMTFVFDCVHLVKNADRLKRKIKASTRELEIIGGYQRSVSALLNEAASSGGGWIREELITDGAEWQVVYEDFDDRGVTAIPVERLSDADDGLRADFEYGEVESENFTLFRVPSFGDMQRFTVAGGLGVEAWRSDATWVLPASFLLVLHLDYLQPIFGPAAPDITQTAGTAVTVTLFDFGVGARLEIQAAADGATITQIIVRGAVGIRRSTERIFVEVDKAVAGEPSRVLDTVEMPAQGSKTADMDAVRDWLSGKYYHGSVQMTASWSPQADVPGLEESAGIFDLLRAYGRGIGRPVWVKHKTGPGHWGLDELFYLLGRRIVERAGDPPQITWYLEKA